MLDAIFSNTVSESMTFSGTVLIILSALALGLGVSLVYIYTHKKEEYNTSFTITLIMLPAIIAMIILLVGNNVARAFSLAGAFSLIRFRSAPGDSKDIAYVFFTLGTGLACGMGYIGYAALFAIILCSAMIVLNKINFGGRLSSQMRLKIVIPEDLDYQGVFDEVLNEYTNTYKLSKIKTTEFGSLFEISYDITMKDMSDSKGFIDKLRCKNGNLNIVLHMREDIKPSAF
jgi:hypothetical protein